MAVEHTLRDQLRAREHLLERVRHRVHHEEVARPTVPAERRHRRLEALVHADRHPELLGRVPERLVDLVDDRASETRVRADEGGDEPELLAGAGRNSRTASSGDWNGTMAVPRYRSGATAQYSASQSLYARAIGTAASGSVIPQKPRPIVG